MRRLYPDLAGAHPLLRGRNVTQDDIQEYKQFGTSFFVNSNLHTNIPIPFHMRVKSLLDVFLVRNAARSFLYSPIVPAAATSIPMDWPHLRGVLRSGETLAQGPSAPHDQRSRMPIFWVTMKQIAMREIADRRERAVARNSSAHRDFTMSPNGNHTENSGPRYSGFQHTTLDPGGDCHRQPVVKVTGTQLQEILKADVCFVTAGNDTFRTLNCTSRGIRGQQNFVLATTSFDGIANLTAFYGAKKLFKACGTEESARTRSTNTKIYVWNAVKRAFEPNTVRDETSLSKRVRISPLWNMLTRLKGNTAAQGIHPRQAWEKTDPRRHDNPRWAPTTDKTAVLDPAWNTDWVFTNTDPKCSGAGFGHIAFDDWYNNPRKADTCLDIAQAYSREKGTCLKELANSFDICQIDELKDFCGAVQSIRAELRQVNAVANQYTLLHKKLYLPSRYLKQDGMFGWSAMVETYNTIDPSLVSDPSMCPGIAKLLQNAAANNQLNQECPATWLFQTSFFLEKVRNIVSSVVTIVVLGQNVASDGILFFLSVMAPDKGMMKEKAEEMNSGLKSIVVKMLDYYREMLQLLRNIITMQEGVLKSISDIIKKLCNFTRKMTLMALKVATQFINAVKKLLPFIKFGSAIRDLEKAGKSVNAWDCDLLPKVLPEAPRPARQLHASLCFIEQNGCEMPADALGGRAGEYSCGPTSFCLAKVLSTQPAKMCVECCRSSVTLLRGYSCDLATCQCICGERELTATKCVTSQDCSLVDSVCNVQASFYKESYTAQLFFDSPGQSYCMKTNMHDAIGKCTSRDSSLYYCVVPIGCSLGS